MISQLLELLQNPNARMLAKPMFELLGERYGRHQKIIERVALSLQTQDDVQDFLKLFVDAYEAGYFRAVNEQKDKLEKLGYDVKITQPAAVNTKTQGTIF